MDDIMAAQRLYYAVPSVYDPTPSYSFPDGDSGGQSLPPHPNFFEPLDDFEGQMTQLHPQPYGGEESIHWQHAPAASPNETASSQSDEVAKSPGPGRYSHGSLSATVGGSCQSMSPSGASNDILTPTSTVDYADGSTYGDQESDNPVSPTNGNHNSPMDDFVHTSDGEMSGGKGRRIVHQPPPSGGRPHIAGQQPSRRMRESSASQQSSNQTTQGQQWIPNSNSFNSSSGMDDPYMPYDPSADMVYSTNAFVDDEQQAAQVGGFDVPSLQGDPYGHLPFRPHDHIQQVSSSYANPALLSQQQMFRQNAPGNFNQNFNQQFNNTAAFNQGPQFSSNMNAAGFGYNAQQMTQRAFQQYPQHPMQPTQRRMPAQVPLNTTMLSMGNVPSSASVRPQSHPQQQQFPQGSIGSVSPLDEKPIALKGQSSRSARGSHDSTSVAAAVVKRPLRQADPTAPRAQPQGGVRKGGRSKHSHLSEPSRAKSHNMRKVGACWRCVLQRDPCDEGIPCTRCQLQAQRGQLYYFPCDRSKLPDFVHDFLPPQASMTLMHQKQSIEDTVSEQVLSWDQENGMDVYLSSGYGPPLVWRLYEFTPKTQELLSQLQFYQDPQTGQSMSRFKYSPPFGLLKIDTSDDAHFDTYLDTLLEPENLWDFGWSCYEEESQVDADQFQATLLDYMCKLYLNTSDQALKSLLKDILRMMIITFIMGHTLTIVEGTLPTVLSHIRHSARPQTTMKHTSPRLANRQLKFFFAVLRNNIYEKILKWQQQTLHTAGKKDTTWLQAFCVMLGFAMVLEEVQRTIQIQADAAGQKGEMSWEGAEVQARNACERIDHRFKLLVGLFQCKYRDKRWGEGSFGPQTPEMKEPVQVEFLRGLRALVETRWDHLRSRESVTFSRENQCLYTTRLTARFLLPFLNLPG